VSELSITTAFQNGRTGIADCFFTSPLKVAKPFFHDDNYIEIMVMCASPGMLPGDRYDMRFYVSDNTKTIISWQSYQKLFNSGNGAAEQNTRIQVEENAVLCYLPYPVIPFAGSRFRAQTDITLRSSSKLIFGEIVTCGRHGMGERFAFSELTSRTTVSIGDRLVFLDNSRLFAEEADFAGLGFFEGYACQGFFYLYGYSDVFFPVCKDVEAAASKLRAGYVIRVLGNSGGSVYRFAQNLFAQLR
jgi:urease accessory protein